MAPATHRERIDAFLDHSRSFEGLRYVYPVVSRRSGGLSIGVNLNRDKKCNFDCVYCQVDRAIPPTVLSVDLEILTEELDAVMTRVLDGRIWEHPRLSQTPDRLRRLNDIAFSGDGEPTTEKRFPEAIKIATELLTRCGLHDVTPVLITDAACLHHERVRRGLDLMDANQGIIWGKLDAGTTAFYERVNRTQVPFRRVLANLAMAASSYRVVIQSLFFRFDDIPPSEEELEAYCKRLVEIEAEGPLEEIHIYTIARRPADPSCTPLRDAEVDDLVARVSKHAKAPVRGFYGPPEL